MNKDKEIEKLKAKIEEQNEQLHLHNVSNSALGTKMFAWQKERDPFSGTWYSKRRGR